jgi:hypothetical protein
MVQKDGTAQQVHCILYASNIIYLALNLSHLFHIMNIL